MKPLYEKLLNIQLEYMRGILRDALKDGLITDKVYDELYNSISEIKHIVINEKWSKSNEKRI